MAKATTSPKRRRSKEIGHYAALVIEDLDFHKDGGGERYEIQAVPYDKRETAVEEYNLTKHQFRPITRAVAVVVFSKSLTDEAPKFQILKALDYDVTAGDHNVEHPLGKLLAIIGHVTGRAFDAGYRAGIAKAKGSTATKSEKG